MSTTLKPQSLDTNILNGWIDPQETWEYVSVDDPTGVFRINADVTTKYSAGMRIKIVNGGNTIYGIITAVSAYNAVDAGYTHITFLHQIDPTDSLALVLMANSAITANYYSTQKAPFGFPLDPRKWTIQVKNTTTYSKTINIETWENLGSIAITIPIGLWLVSKRADIYGASNNLAPSNFSSLSTANNSESDIDFTSYHQLRIAATGNDQRLKDTHKEEKIISIASKTTYYLIVKAGADNIQIDVRGAITPTIIKAECVYL